MTFDGTVLETPALEFRGVGGNSNISARNYAIYQESGSWSSPYPDLVIGYHTGIKIGGYLGYNGTRFYNDAPGRSGATEIFSVGNGDNHVRVLNNLIVSGTGDFTGDVTFRGGAAAVNIAANSDIRFTNGNWTGNSSSPKIQAHGNYLYIAGGSNGIIFRENGTDRCRVDASGHFRPASNNTYDSVSYTHLTLPTIHLV